MVSGGGAFGRCSGHEGGALMNGICALEEKNTGNKESQMVEGNDSMRDCVYIGGGRREKIKCKGQTPGPVKTR